MLPAATATKRRARHSQGGIPLPRADGRTLGAKRFRALVEALEREFGGALTEADRLLVAQCAAVAVHIEKLQQDIVEGGDVDADTIVRLSSEHRRLLTSLRAKAAKNIPASVLTPLEYAARKAAEKAASASDGEVA